MGTFFHSSNIFIYRILLLSLYFIFSHIKKFFELISDRLILNENKWLKYKKNLIVASERNQYVFSDIFQDHVTSIRYNREILNILKTKFFICYNLHIKSIAYILLRFLSRSCRLFMNESSNNYFNFKCTLYIPYFVERERKYPIMCTFYQTFDVHLNM